MMNSDNQQNSTSDGGGAQAEEPGYHTPGQDTLLHSGSEAVLAPTETSEQRMTDPPPVIKSIGERPGDANPALAATIGEEKGNVSTADLLRAREAAEEQPVRGRGLQAYEDQPANAQLDDFAEVEEGRPNWPDDLNVEPLEYMESPRADVPLGTGAPEYFGPNFKGRVDAEMDRSSTQAAANESRSGLSPVGMEAEEDKYERREFERPEPPSDMDMIAPDMVNLPPGDNNG